MQRYGRTLGLASAATFLALAINVLALLGNGPASAGPLDSYKLCNDKFGRANDQNRKATDALFRLFKKANNADMHKTDPVKYCDWHKKNVMAVSIKGVRRMEERAKDPSCFNDPIAVASYEALAQIYKSDERWMSALCLGIQPY